MGVSHVGGTSSAKSRNSHRNGTKYRDSRTRGLRAILVNMLAYYYYSAINIEGYLKSFFDIIKCALPSSIVRFFLN